MSWIISFHYFPHLTAYYILPKTSSLHQPLATPGSGSLSAGETWTNAEVVEP